MFLSQKNGNNRKKSLIPNRYHVIHCVIAGLTRNLQQINGIAGQASNDGRGYFDSGLVQLTELTYKKKHVNSPKIMLATV